MRLIAKFLFILIFHVIKKIGTILLKPQTFQFIIPIEWNKALVEVKQSVLWTGQPTVCVACLSAYSDTDIYIKFTKRELRKATTTTR